MGDVYDRIIVRLLEVGQSIGIIRQCLDTLPAGEILWEPKMAKLLSVCKKAEGEAIGRVEAPRGECMHYVRMAGKEAPESWKIKASSYSNLMSWIPMLQGEQTGRCPDHRCIHRSLPLVHRPCHSGEGTEGLILLTKEDLTRLSREKTRRLLQ